MDSSWFGLIDQSQATRLHRHEALMVAVAVGDRPLMGDRCYGSLDLFGRPCGTPYAPYQH